MNIVNISVKGIPKTSDRYYTLGYAYFPNAGMGSLQLIP